MTPHWLASFPGPAAAFGRIFDRSAEGSMRVRFARSAFWSLVGAVVSQGSALLASIVTARVLGRNAFGELGMIQATVGMLGAFAGMGLGLTATKHVSEFRQRHRDRAGRIIALTSTFAVLAGGVVSIALLALAPTLAMRTLNAAHLSGDLRIAAGLLLFGSLNGVQTGVLAGFDAFRAIASVNLAKGVLSLPITVAGVVLWGLRGGVLALVVAAAVGSFLNQLAIRRECASSGIRVRYSSMWSERGVLWDFSLPAFLSGAMAGPATWAAQTMLVNEPGGYAEMGVFNAANQWRMALLFVPGLLGLPLVALMSTPRAVGEENRSRKLLFSSILACGAVAVPVALGVILLRDQIMGTYGAAFAGRGRVLTFAVLSAALVAVQSPMGNAIAAYGRMWAGALTNFGWALCLLAAARYFVRRSWGADGLACAHLVAYVMHGLWTTWYVARLVRRHG